MRLTAIERQLTPAGYPAELAHEAFEAFFDARNRVQFFEGALEVLAHLQRRYRLFALSNGNAELARCGISHLFEGHISARYAGASKPDARIFRALVNAAGVPADHILHVGDDLLADIAGASNAGLRTAWLNVANVRELPAGMPPPDLEVHDLRELESALF